MRPFRLNARSVLGVVGLLVLALLASMLIFPGAHHAVREWLHGLQI